VSRAELLLVALLLLAVACASCHFCDNSYVAWVTAAVQGDPQGVIPGYVIFVRPSYVAPGLDDIPVPEGTEVAVLVEPPDAIGLPDPIPRINRWGNAVIPITPLRPGHAMIAVGVMGIYSEPQEFTIEDDLDITVLY